MAYQKITGPPNNLVVDVKCEVCNGLISKANKYGMLCENECNLEASIKAFDILQKALDRVIAEKEDE